MYGCLPFAPKNHTFYKLISIWSDATISQLIVVHIHAESENSDQYDIITVSQNVCNVYYGVQCVCVYVYANI